MDYKLDPFFDFLNEEMGRRPNELITASPEEFYKIRNEKRAMLKTAVGLDRLERYVCPMKIVPHGEEYIENASDIVIERLGIEILPNLIMPVYIIRSAISSAKKAVLYCHGHGNDGLRSCFSQEGQYHKNMPLTLALRGYTVFTFEPAALGDFRIENYTNQEETACHPLSMRLFLYGMTTIGLRVFQAKCVAEYMREAHKTEVFATVGISSGGAVCAVYGALYDGAAANVISCYSNTFRTSIMAMHHCIDNAIPGILQIGDIPDIIAMNAPKKLFLQNGVNDPIYPADGAEMSYMFVKSIYEKLGISENLKADFFNGAHEFNNSLIDWLDIVK